MEPGLGKIPQDTAQESTETIHLCHDAAKHKAHPAGRQTGYSHPVVHEPFQLPGRTRGPNGF